MADVSAKPPRTRSWVTIPMKPLPGPPRGVSGRVRINAAALQSELAMAVSGEVRFDCGSLGLYATDSSNFRQIPIGVVIPKTAEDVVLTHRICARHGAPILNRGGGTSLSGETVNYAVVIDHSKYRNRIGDADTERRMVTVETGAINEQVNLKMGKVGLVFGPDPSSHAYCAIGGNIGNNSCGVHSVQSQFYGPGPRTSDNVHALDIVTYDGQRFTVGVNEEGELDRIIADGGRKGEIYAKLRELRDRYADLIRQRYPSVEQLPRRVSGYNLDELLPEKGFNPARALVGTEGTCVTVLNATLLLTPALLDRVTVVVAYDDIASASEHVPEIMGWRPIGVEGIDHRLFAQEQRQHLNLGGLERFPQPGHNAWLLVQFGADSAGEVDRRGEEFVNWLKGEKGYAENRITLYRSAEAGGEAKLIWDVREGGLGATAFPPGGKDHWPGWEDSAVPPDRMGPYVRDLQALYGKYGLEGALYGHFGQGCIHSRISFDLRNPDGIRNYRAFLEEASDLVVSYGGSLSGEHGDGQQRAEFLVKQYGPELVDAMREFKRIWDPGWNMNPGKVVDAYRADENLKLGVDYDPPHPRVKFAYEEDGGDFAHATIRCVGVGKCRTPEGADVMCPSYVVTREEKDTTRGRARLLFEMLEGDVIVDGWKSEEVRAALDLCLACKGCTNDCPVHVDMPTYKSEFLYHYFHGPRRNRKRYMYAFGFIDQAARVASLAPEVVNFLTRTPPFSHLSRAVAGLDQHRSIPEFAPMTLQAWFRRRGAPRNPNGPKVVLWPDTFNNHFHTDVGVAAVEALEEAGWHVIMPRGHVCCGRPLYDYGFLDMAERYLRHTIRALRPEIRAGTPVVGMEPSCLAVFRDELTKILPHDDDAERLRRNAFHFSEFFDRHDIALPRLERRAVLWGHCHHKATGGIGPEKDLLGSRMGLDVHEAHGGCCGLAGSWGFEPGHYNISMECAEQGFLPAARGADPDTLIVADGFSCKTQLAEAHIGREALHTAQVMKLAREHGTTGGPGAHPESHYVGHRPSPPVLIRLVRTGAALAAGAALAGGMVAAGRAIARGGRNGIVRQARPGERILRR